MGTRVYGHLQLVVQAQEFSLILEQVELLLAVLLNDLLGAGLALLGRRLYFLPMCLGQGVRVRG